MASLTLECHNCGKAFDVSFTLEDLEFEVTYSKERQMGPEICNAACIYISCPKCNQEGEITLNCWEYPINSFNYCDFETREGEFSIISFSGCEDVCWEHIQRKSL